MAPIYILIEEKRMAELTARESSKPYLCPTDPSCIVREAPGRKPITIPRLHIFLFLLTSPEVHSSHNEEFDKLCCLLVDM